MAMQSDGEAEIDQSVDNTLIHVIMLPRSSRDTVVPYRNGYSHTRAGHKPLRQCQ